MSLSDTFVEQFVAQFFIGVSGQWEFSLQHFLINLILTSRRIKVPESVARNVTSHRVFDNHEVTGGIVFHVLGERMHQLSDGRQRWPFWKYDGEAICFRTGFELETGHCLKVRGRRGDPGEGGHITVVVAASLAATLTASIRRALSQPSTQNPFQLEFSLQLH